MKAHESPKKKALKVAKTKWWIEPLSQTANTSLFLLLGGYEAPQESVTCSGGEKKDLYVLRNYDDVRRYLSSSLSVNYYKQQGSGLPTKWTPPKERKKSKKKDTEAEEKT